MNNHLKNESPGTTKPELMILCYQQYQVVYVLTSEQSNVKAHTKDDSGYTVALVARYMDKICVVFLSPTKNV
jgi:hypothetical protein